MITADELRRIRNVLAASPGEIGPMSAERALGEMLDTLDAISGIAILALLGDGEVSDAEALRQIGALAIGTATALPSDGVPAPLVGDETGPTRVIAP